MLPELFLISLKAKPGLEAWPEDSASLLRQIKNGDTRSRCRPNAGLVRQSGLDGDAACLLCVKTKMTRLSSAVLH